MLSCLIDYIGVRDCTETISLSGDYINSLPGIELKMMDKVATAEQVNFAGLWDDVQKTAADKFYNEVVLEFDKRYKIKTLTKSINIEKKIDTTSVTALDTDYRGFTLELNQDNDDWVPSNLQSIYIQYLNIYLPAAVNTTVKIFDLDTQTQVFSLAVTGALGWNQVTVMTNFPYRRLYVCYDASTVNSVELDITKLSQSFYDHAGCCAYYCAGQVKIKGADSTIADKYTITEGENTFGLSAIFSIKCSYEAFICNNLETFKTPWKYILGEELMNYRLYTSRLNEFSIDKTKATELKALYNTEFKNQIQMVVGGVNLNMGDECLQCNETYRYVDAKL